MKLLFLFLITLPSFACSEMGKSEFKLKKESLSKCAKLAGSYAEDFANSVLKHEGNGKDFKGPKKLTASSKGATIYQALAPAGEEKSVGFNATLVEGNHECTYCVDLKVDQKENCRIESVRKFTCNF